MKTQAMKYMEFEKNGQSGRVLTNPDFISGVYIAIYLPNEQIPVQLTVAHKSFSRKWAQIKANLQKDGFTITKCN